MFGTPTAQANNIPRADVPNFLRDFLNKPQELNHFQTMNRYWMEDSFGKYGVQLDAFGPYRLPGRSYQYFMTEFSFGGQGNSPAHCPDVANYPCNKNFRTDARAAWVAAAHDAAAGPDHGRRGRDYDNIFYVSAGEDESATWQEFGTMKFKTQDDVTDDFGPKQPTAT